MSLKGCLDCPGILLRALISIRIKGEPTENSWLVCVYSCMRNIRYRYDCLFWRSRLPTGSQENPLRRLKAVSQVVRGAGCVQRPFKQ